MKYLRKITFIFILIATPFISNAQSLDSKGNEFWLAFMETYANFDTPELSFFISSDTDTEVTIEIPSLNQSETINIPANLATKYIVPNTLETTEFDTVVETAIKITSLEEISVYGLSRIDVVTDAFLGLPTDVLGQDYIVLAHGDSINSSLRSEFLIVATQDNTIVTVTPSLLDTSLTDPIQIELEEGQVYQHRPNSEEDVTGTEITSNAPITVFGGHQCANVPDASVFACDHLVEQLPPVNTWGTQFFTAPLATRLNGDLFKFLASEDSTTINIGNNDPIIIDRGEFYETILTEASFVSSDKPILVGQYSNSSTFDNVTADPFMMLIPPFEQFLDNYTFSTPTEGFRINYLNVVTRTSDISSLQLNMINLSPDDFTEIGSSNYSFAQIELENGSHTLNGALAGIYVYGYDTFDSYGYPGGLSLSRVADIENIELIEEYQIIDGEACFSVLVSDLNNLPLQDIRVDFLVDLISGFDATDTDGIAEFCVEAGPNPDEFEVTASVGGETVNGTVTQEQIDQVVEDSESSSGGGGCSLGTKRGFIDPTLPLIALVCLFVSLRRRNKYKIEAN